MMIWAVDFLQRVFGIFGLHVRRLNNGVQIDNAFEEQLRLAGSSPKCIIEIGAADGRDTELYAMRLPSAKIIAFEPLPENFAKLLEKSKNYPAITAIECALSDRVGNAKFNIAELADASSLLNAKKTGQTFDKYTNTVAQVDVKVTTLDQYCQENNIESIDLLKVDAQGAELLILEGAHELLSKKSIKVMYLEVNFLASYENSCLYHHVANHLEKFGYRLHSLYNLVHGRDGTLAWGDAIFVK